MTLSKNVAWGCSALAALALLGCGGGGGGSSATTPSPSGVVAVGAPLSGATIEAVDIEGNKETVIADANGKFQISSNLRTAFLLRAKPPATIKSDVNGVPSVMYSIGGVFDDGDAVTIININPLSNVITKSLTANANLGNLNDYFDGSKKLSDAVNNNNVGAIQSRTSAGERTFSNEIAPYLAYLMGANNPQAFMPDTEMQANAMATKTGQDPADLLLELLSVKDTSRADFTCPQATGIDDSDKTTTFSKCWQFLPKVTVDTNGGVVDSVRRVNVYKSSLPDVLNTQNRYMNPVTGGKFTAAGADTNGLVGMWIDTNTYGTDASSTTASPATLSNDCRMNGNCLMAPSYIDIATFISSLDSQSLSLPLIQGCDSGASQITAANSAPVLYCQVTFHGTKGGAPEDMLVWMQYQGDLASLTNAGSWKVVGNRPGNVAQRLQAPTFNN